MRKTFKISNYIILFAVVFANIFLFSSVSPIHSILNLQYDEQVYNLIGKGMKYGLVPYIDLIDHKGIYLFMIYALAHVIGEWHHIGLFIVTLIINYVTAIFTFKSSMILCQAKSKSGEAITSIAVAFSIIFILNLALLSTCGLDCETTIIPWIVISFYLTLDYAFDDEKKYYPLRYIFIDGILTALIIFTKANATMFFLAKAIYLLTEEMKKIKKEIKKSIKHLLLMVVFGLLGLCIGLLPGIIYCISTNSFSEMINHSFVINFKYMGALLPAASDYFDAFIRTIKKFWIFTIVVITSVPMLICLLRTGNKKVNEVEVINKKSKTFIFFYILSLVFMLYIVFAPLRPYTHYLIFLLIYFIPVFIFIYSRLNKIVIVVAIILLNILSYPFNLKVGLETGKYQSEIVNEVKKVYDDISLTKNNDGMSESDAKPNLLVVGYSPYLYDYFNVFPITPYFATPMVLAKDYAKPYEELLEALGSRKADIIVTDFGANMIKGNPTYRDVATAAILKNYKENGRFSRNSAIYVRRQ